MAGPSRGTDALSAPQWRQFNFFDLDSIKDPEDLAASPKGLRDLKPPVVVCPTSEASPLQPAVIISSGNSITLFDRHFTVIRSFTAWEGTGRATALVEAGGLLLAVGEDEGSRLPVLKVWDLTREAKKAGGSGPVLMRNVRIQHTSGRPHPVSAVALTSNLSHLAIGLDDGTVLLYRHLLQALTSAPTSLTSLPKARVALEANERAPEAITGLGFREVRAEKGNTTATTLYIVTTNRVLSTSVSAKGGEARTLDETGSGLGCAVMDANRDEMIVARDEAIQLFAPESRGVCYAYEGPKSSISVSRQNLIIVSPGIHAPTPAARRQMLAGSGAGTTADTAKVTILDLENKLVSFTGAFRHGIRAVFAQWGNIYIYEGDGQMSKLEEHSTSAKLEVLYKRNLFTQAMSLAQSQAVVPATIAEIHRQYGDYLYGKGDFDGAMAQFVNTLGYIQPSYVIRKFLDAQRINNLTTFLQELHARGLANPDHTTLLLNCYTKTSDRARLDSFIKTEVRRQDGETLPFDLETAIQVCRQAGFYEHATYLARKFNRHEDYLRIQIENAEEYDDAILYLRSLGPEACEENLLRYGRSLLQHAPQATTELLIDLCSGTLGRTSGHAYIHSSLEESRTPNGGGGGTGGAVLSYLPGVNRLFGTDGRETPSPALATADVEVKDAPVEAEQGPSYIPPSPRQFFAHFVDHRELFVHFLEDVAFALWGQKVDGAAPRTSGTIPRRHDDGSTSLDDEHMDQRAVWNTLLELYLDSTATGDLAAKGKALALLGAADVIPYDPMHALVLCSFSGFTDGLVGLWESLGMYEDVLRYWMEKDVASVEGKGDSTEGPKPSDEVMRYLDLYGPENPSLYPMVLRYLTSSAAVLSRHQEAVPGILETIDTERIMPPLAVVQLLSRNGVASVGTVKSWLRSKVEETRQETDADKALVQSYRTETAVKEKQIADLTNVRQPEVFQVTQCAACGGQLDLPAVHFMCKHSFHQRCLSDAEPECILCAQQHAMVREIRNSQTRLADRHDLFLGEVHEADDGFAVVAGAYGRGLFQAGSPA